MLIVTKTLNYHVYIFIPPVGSKWALVHAQYTLAVGESSSHNSCLNIVMLAWKLDVID